MSIEKELLQRSGSKCELCTSTDNLKGYEVLPAKNGRLEESVMVCSTCLEQIENPDKMQTNHWRCLNDSMWSEVPSVQVVVWRMLNRLRSESWPQDLLDMLYLSEETLAWAQATGEGNHGDDTTNHIDSNGVVLQNGDTVTLIKDLNVKGATFAAKRGTAVRGITLVTDNPEHIEGKINGQQIVLLTKFVKKSS